MYIYRSSRRFLLEQTIAVNGEQPRGRINKALEVFNFEEAEKLEVRSRWAAGNGGIKRKALVGQLMAKKS